MELIERAIARIEAKPLFDAQCVVAVGLSMFAGKWSPLLLMALMQGTRRYSDLQRQIPDISPKMLAQSLRALEKNGLVSRKVYPEVPPRTEYSLTAFGQSLKLPLAALIEWSVEQEQNILPASTAVPDG